jgi:hypothetical protein
MAAITGPLAEAIALATTPTRLMVGAAHGCTVGSAS